MEIQEEIENFRKHYQDVIKPFIEQEEYMIAYFELGNFILVMNEDTRATRELLTQFHMGPNFLASVKLLQERLKEGEKSGIEIAAKRFEAYSAQTKLPCTYGNRKS